MSDAAQVPALRAEVARLQAALTVEVRRAEEVHTSMSAAVLDEHATAERLRKLLAAVAAVLREQRLLSRVSAELPSDLQAEWDLLARDGDRG